MTVVIIIVAAVTEDCNNNYNRSRLIAAISVENKKKHPKIEGTGTYITGLMIWQKINRFYIMRDPFSRRIARLSPP